MTDMPSGPHKSPHSFQLYIKQCLTHTRLREIWRAYLTDVIAETGRVWQTFIKPMGLRPLDTAPRDVVVVVGGPDTAFIVRDSSMKAMAELVPLPFDSPRRDLGKHTEVVRTTTGTPVSQLLGTCYLQSVMSGEMDEEDTARRDSLLV
ncbi:hypothetical protein HBI65_123400 [Parastagonospora nodorum]|nr:hypothetical protein HBH54_135120 [Parastagonospora nodorum]KAH4160902.1 hypothetical protein HBH44_102460 [Parastagonospora nodorum]KAH4631274.1 hypothetical protein HBH55_094670 [Parastagonospora nodorum]KAH4640001.1 hypothetical protein HBH81_097860 [Parastagonospora nodorum]KAH5020672.1 hypothetical protein HBI75_166120 [Parastagonospora nodorum]